jgi:Domain of unknown function (DUF4878)
VGLAVLVVLAVAGGAFLLLSGDDDRSPEETVQLFFEAFNDEDCEGLVDVLTRDSWAFLMSEDGEEPPEDVSRQDAIDDCQSTSDEDEPIEVTLDEVTMTSEEGDEAVAEVTSTTDGEQTTESVVLSREEGDWRIDLVATNERDSESGE